MPLTLYLSNDNVLELTGLINTVTNTYLNSATVTVTLVDNADVEVSGETWPLTMTYVAASDGKYRATLTDSLSIIGGTRYTAKIAADSGAGLKGYWECRVVAEIRKCN